MARSAKSVFDKASPSRLLAGSVWFLAFMLASGFAWWLWTIIASRAFGPEGYGIFSIASSIMWFVTVLLFGGAFQGLMKYGSEHLAKDRRKARKVLVYFASSLKYLSLLGLLVCLLLLSSFFMAVEPQMRIILAAVAFVVLASGLRHAVSAIIGSTQRTNYLSIVTASGSFFVLASGLAIILLGFDFTIIPFVLVFGAIGQLLVSIYLLKKSFPFGLRRILRARKSFKVFIETYKYGMLVSLALIAIYLIKNLDIIVLKIFLPYEAVGIYSVAEAYSRVFFYITSIALPLIPAISEAFARKRTRLLRTYVSLAIKWSLIIGLASTILMLIMAENLVVDIYGEAFSDAILPLRMLIPGTFIILLCYNLSAVLVGLGKAKLSGTLLFISALIYVALLFFLVPIYGILGAAIASLLMAFSTNLLIPYYVKKFTKVKFPKGSIKLIVSAMAMAAFLFFVPKINLITTVIEASAGLFLFGALLYLTKYISREDVKMLRVVASSFKQKR